MHYSNEHVETIERIRAFALRNYKPIAQKKIFLFHGRLQFGEERLAQYFYQKGYLPIIPERLSLEEQLNIFINCESFASTLGSASHNVMFMSDCTEVIIIPRFTVVNAYQQITDQIRDNNIFYIDSTFSVFANGPLDPFCYIISKQLKNFFGDNLEYADEDFIVFLAYLKFAMSRGLKINMNVIKSCGKVWQEFFNQLNQRKDLQAKVGLFIK